MASSNRPPPLPRTVFPPLLVDIKYKLVYQCLTGRSPRECSDSNDHIHIETGINSYLNPLIPSKPEQIIRVHFAWAKYSGELSGAYNKAKDTLFSTRLLEETLQKGAETDRAIANIEITLFKERTQNGTLVENGGRYVRVNFEFAGSPALSAKVWGKRVKGDELLGAMRLSEEERLRLVIGGSSGNGNQI